MGPKRKTFEDSDDDFDDDDRDAQVARCLQNEEFNQSSIVPPSLSLRRSSRLATNIPTQAATANTLPSDSLTAAKKPRLGAAESDVESLYTDSDPGEQLDLTDDDDAMEIFPQVYVDDQGLIRVGPQPKEAQADIQSAPREYAENLLERRIKEVHQATDTHLPGSDPSKLQQTASQLRNELLSSLIEFDKGWVKYLCDYTGVLLLWTSGPLSLSVESIYPVVIFERSPVYYVSLDVCLTMSYVRVVV